MAVAAAGSGSGDSAESESLAQAVPLTASGTALSCQWPGQTGPAVTGIVSGTVMVTALPLAVADRPGQSQALPVAQHSPLLAGCQCQWYWQTGPGQSLTHCHCTGSAVPVSLYYHYHCHCTNASGSVTACHCTGTAVTAPL